MSTRQWEENDSKLADRVLLARPALPFGHHEKPRCCCYRCTSGSLKGTQILYRDTQVKSYNDPITQPDSA
jgi:hypothetical protein